MTMSLWSWASRRWSPAEFGSCGCGVDEVCVIQVSSLLRCGTEFAHPLSPFFRCRIQFGVWRKVSSSWELLRTLPSFGPISISQTIYLISALFVSHVEGTGQLLSGISCFWIEWCWIRCSGRSSVCWMYGCTVYIGRARGVHNKNNLMAYLIFHDKRSLESDTWALEAFILRL